MKSLTGSKRIVVCLAFNLALACSVGGQTTWIGPTGDEWNTALDWDLGAAPAEGTNAIINTAVTVNYNVPMTAAAFEALAVSAGATLNINTNGFTVGGPGNNVISVSNANTRLFINDGGVVSITNGGVQFGFTAAGSLAPGGTLTASGSLLAGGSGTGNTGIFTNNGGNLTVGALSINPNNNSSSSLVVINGGTNDFGSVSILRSGAGSGGFSTFGSEGLIISDGLVRMTNLTVGVGGNSFLTMFVGGGTVTNTGDFIIRQITSGRASRFWQTGGLMVSSGANGVRVGVTNAGQNAIYAVMGGTNLAEGFTLGDITNSSGTVNFTNAAHIYVGSGGLVSNSVGTLNLVLNNGGTFGASADWSSPLAMLLSGGTFTFNGASLDGTPHTITLSGVLRGSGALAKRGPGIVTLTGTNTYSGNTLVNQGVLALGSNAGGGLGSISNSPQILVASGAVFDVSAVSGFNLVGSQALGGSGSVTGSVNALGGTSLRPGGTGVAGTLTLSSGLGQVGGVINDFDLSDDPSGLTKANDQILVQGDLTISGVNTILVNTLNGPLPSATYVLLKYTGNLNGSVANLALSGAAGTLVHDAVAKAISLQVSTTRAPANVKWAGTASANTWNMLLTANWLNGAALDVFVAGDSATFDDSGVSTVPVNVDGIVTPASVLVDATTHYTFGGGGNISGSSGLTKTNTGTLTVLTSNGYTGPTLIGGGTLEAAVLANGGSPSSLGASGAEASNLVLQGSTLRYLGGSASSDRGITIDGGAATFDVASNGTALTLGGSVVGTATLVKAGPGTLTLGAANTYAGGTVISNGTLQMNLVGAINSAGVTNRNSTLRFGGAFTVVNVVEFSGACIIDLNNAGGDAALTGAWSGDGTVTVINQQNASRTFTVGGNGSGGGSLANFFGTISMGANPGFLRFNDGGTSPNLGSTNVTIDLGTGSSTFLVRNGGVTVDLGALAGGPDTKLSGRGSGNSGIVTYSIGAKNLPTTFAGTIKDGNNFTALLKVGDGTLTLAGTNTYGASTVISNGVLALVGEGCLSNSPTLNIATNAVLDVSGRSDGTLVVNTNQTLVGEGAVRGSATVAEGGIIAPGEPAAIGVMSTMIITNALTLLPGSSVIMDVDSGTWTNDLLTGMSHVHFGGALTLANSPTGVTNGASFKLFNAASYSGAFQSIQPDISSMNLMWDQSTLAVDGTLRVSLLRPTIGSSGIEGSNFVFRGDLGTPFATYHVLTSTNLINWVPVLTNIFEADGSFAYTNALGSSPANEFFRIVIPAP